VGALENCKNPSLVAKAIMDHTDHIMLVGAGASKFAQDMGFEKVNLLTDRSRQIWMLWRQHRSMSDAWGPGLDSPEYKENLEKKAAELGIPEEWRAYAVGKVLQAPTGTINCLAVNAKGEISGVTTTSGLAWKISGRVGDSPIIGAGCYVDGEVGGGGSTGRGEENIRIAGGHTIVEMMRQGKTPVEACMEALRRVEHNFRFDRSRLNLFELAFYALRVDGAYGAASLWDTDASGKRRRQFAVNDGQNRLEDMAFLLRRPASQAG
jgi:N4-(beta-N-acetylglucosaminyl)-L-asparaginase